MNDPIDLMVDLETMSKRANAAILSIGAVPFNVSLKGIVLPAFYKQVKPEYNHKAFHVDSETLAWWEKQDPEVRKETFSGELVLSIVLDMFLKYLDAFNAPVRFWSYGANFDEPILNHAYMTYHHGVPWSYKNVRCFRTLAALFYFIPPPEMNSTKHNALADAQYQAAHAEAIFNYMRAKELL